MWFDSYAYCFKWHHITNKNWAEKAQNQKGIHLKTGTHDGCEPTTHTVFVPTAE